MKTRQYGSTVLDRIILVAIIAVLVAIAVPRGHEHHRNFDKYAHADARDLLTALIYNSVPDTRQETKGTASTTPHADAKSGGETAPLLICSGNEGKVDVSASGFVKTPFRTHCSPDVIMYLAVTESAAYVAAAHSKGHCIQVGSTDSGSVQRGTPTCDRDSPDWSGSLPKNIVLHGLKAARALKGSQ